VATSSELGRKWFRAIHEHDIEGAMGLLSDEVEFASPGAHFTGSGAARPFLEGYIGGFPDGGFDLRTSVESGGTVAIEGTWIATNTGAFMAQLGLMLEPSA
jgi:SnoaL-like protein